MQGSSSGSPSGTPVWTIVSKPAGAPDPVISNVNFLTPNVTGMTVPGNYVFQVAQNCSPSGSATSQVTITAPGDVSTFTAGPDITNISATTGVATLSGVIPPGYTASWTYYNIFNQEKYSQITTTNATMSNTTTATPTLTLTKKANHDIDPAYRVVMRITSINNPSCWYEGDAIVRFIPNPQIVINTPQSLCSTNSDRYIFLSGISPQFATSTTNSSGNSAFGTTITVNPSSQPAGGNISFWKLENNIMYFNGVNTIAGTYKFTITITNANGSYTTPEITFNYNGPAPNRVSFLDSAHPEQMMIYFSGGSGGAVYCNKAGNTDPITVYFKIDPADPATVTTTLSNFGIIPPGGSPTLALNGSGTMNRNIVATPPAGGWRVGTYVIRVNTGNGTCNITQDYYIHISDGSRPNVTVPTTTVCYPGSGVVTATIPLPAVYEGVVNSSYFQGFSGRYDFTVVSKPAGSANPTYDATNLRTLTNTSTVIGNLDKPGEYVFTIKAVPNAGGVDAGFLNQEYACSGTSLQGTFSIFVSAQVGSNAGSAQTLVGTTQTTFNANNPGVAATGMWTLLTKPAGATDPAIVTPSSYNTNVTGFNTPGTYTFRWTVTTGTCTVRAILLLM